MAYVVLRIGADCDGLDADPVDRVRRRIGPHLAPRRIVRVPERPMTATGKVRRGELRARGQGGRSRKKDGLKRNLVVP